MIRSAHFFGSTELNSTACCVLRWSPFLLWDARGKSQHGHGWKWENPWLVQNSRARINFSKTCTERACSKSAATNSCGCLQDVSCNAIKKVGNFNLQQPWDPIYVYLFLVSAWFHLETSWGKSGGTLAALHTTGVSPIRLLGPQIAFSHQGPRCAALAPVVEFKLWQRFPGLT